MPCYQRGVWRPPQAGWALGTNAAPREGTGAFTAGLIRVVSCEATLIQMPHVVMPSGGEECVQAYVQRGAHQPPCPATALGLAIWAAQSSTPLAHAYAEGSCPPACRFRRRPRRTVSSSPASRVMSSLSDEDVAGI